MHISLVQFYQLLDLTIQASRNVILYHPHRVKNLEVMIKSDKSPVTLADLTTNQLICDGLAKMFPDILVISEENDQLDHSIRKNQTWIWLVDPLDGTKEFVNGGQDYTVNIGLIYNGQPVFGLVSQPETNLLYVGWINQTNFQVEFRSNKTSKQAYQLDYSDYLDRISIVQFKQLVCCSVDSKTKLKVVISKSHVNQQTEIFLSQFPEIELVNIGSSLKIIKVADGSADLYPRLGLTSEWDTAASHAILLGSGGKLFQLNNSNYQLSEFSYNKDSLLNPYFICGHPNLLLKLFTK